MTKAKDTKTPAVNEADPKAETVTHTPELTDAEKTAAEKEGVKAAYAQSAQTNFATQSATESDGQPGDRWPGRHEIMAWAPTIDLGLDAFVAAVAEGADPLIPEDKIAGLMELERSGKNRTQYVAALCKRLGVKTPFEVTTAGPAYTNDVTSVNSIAR